MDLLDVTQGLSTVGYSVFPDFLLAADMEELSRESDTLRIQGNFRRGGIGQGEHRRVNDAERQDEICWMDPLALSAPQIALWARLEALREAVDQALWLGLWSLEGHYSVYPPGGFYHRHRDSFRHDDARILSAVIYLNGPWLPEDGGELRLFPRGLAAVDVAPTGGSLVCFLSHEMEHEVRRSQRARKSFACWFARRGLDGTA